MTPGVLLTTGIAALSAIAGVADRTVRFTEIAINQSQKGKEAANACALWIAQPMNMAGDGHS